MGFLAVFAKDVTLRTELETEFGLCRLGEKTDDSNNIEESEKVEDEAKINQKIAKVKENGQGREVV